MFVLWEVWIIERSTIFIQEDRLAINYYNEIYEQIKDYSKEKNRANTYFNIDKLLYKVSKKSHNY